MKALVVLGLLTSLAATAAFAQSYPVPAPAPRPAPVPVPPTPAPGAQRQNLVMRDVNQMYYGPRNHVSLRNYLNLAYGTYVDSLLVVASSDDLTGRIEVIESGRLVTERFLTNRLEVFQVPVNLQYFERHELAVRTSGTVYVAALGATYVGSLVNPTPVPNPVPVPVPPTGPACELVGYGAYNGYNWNYRVRANGQVMEAADNLDQALEKMRKLAEASICSGPAYQSCDLLGYGAYRGYNWNFRVQLGASGLIDASDNLDAALQITSKLRAAQVCVPNNTQRCSVAGAGAYRGYNWRFRVLIGDRIVEAADNLDSATRVMNTLRSAGFCF